MKLAKYLILLAIYFLIFSFSDIPTQRWKVSMYQLSLIAFVFSISISIAMIAKSKNKSKNKIK